MTRTLATLAIAALAVFLAAFAATAGDGEPTSGPDFIDGTALREDFVPLEGQPSMTESAFLLTVRQNARTLADAPERRLLNLRASACAVLNGGFSPESVAGFLDRQHGLTEREAEVVGLAAVGTCAGSVLADSLETGTAT